MKFTPTFRYKCVRFLFATVTAIFLFAGLVSAQTDVTKQMTVSGETGLKWVNTGITVVAGDTVRLDAKGEVDVGGSYGAHGPEGTTDFSEQPVGYYPLETKMRYGLAGRITQGSGRKFQVTQTWVYGEAKEIKVKRSGILWLTVNDDAPEGNVGEFTVTITIIKPAPKAKAKS
ncbi:MAG: hypothetical protein DMF63_06090 [Acidobacteria bacterium]|nr:MAG: hypothetical protein DMF63_06090 [Acidobacteriota bacterium]